MTTNVLKFCRASIANGVAFLVGASGVGCAAGRIYTRLGEGASGSGLFVAWAVDFWGSSISSFPLPSSVIKERISSFFSLGKTTAHISEDSDNPSDNSMKSSISP